MTPDMRIAYIAGPYRSPHGPADHWTVKQHIHQAEDYARFIAKTCGGRVHCHVPQAATAFWSGPDVDEQQWLDGCLALIRRLDPKRDALLILPGSSESQGTRAEAELASSRGLPIFWLPKDRSKLTESVLLPWLHWPLPIDRAPDGSPGSKQAAVEAAR